MTTERRAEIERLCSKCLDETAWERRALNELLVEIDALTAELAAASSALDEVVAPDPDKPLDQRIRDEFHDFDMILSHCGEIYMAASGGLVSKPHTLPSVVIGLMDDMINKIVEDETHALKLELAAKAKALDQAIEATGLRPHGEYLLSVHPSARGCIDTADAPELAAELRKREGI